MCSKIFADSYELKDNPFPSLEELWLCKELVESLARTRRYPPSVPFSHLAIRAMVLEDRPVLSVIALYWTSLDRREAASRRLANSSISPSVKRSRRNDSASDVLLRAKTALISCFFFFSRQSTTGPICCINLTVCIDVF